MDDACKKKYVMWLTVYVCIMWGLFHQSVAGYEGYRIQATEGSVCYVPPAAKSMHSLHITVDDSLLRTIIPWQAAMHLVSSTTLTEGAIP